MAEMYQYDLYDEGEDWLSTAEDNIRKCQWQDSTGNLLKIRSMDTSHIINCQNLIKRKQLDIKYSVFSEYLELFTSELERRLHDEQRIREQFKTNS